MTQGRVMNFDMPDGSTLNVILTETKDRKWVLSDNGKKFAAIGYGVNLSDIDLYSYALTPKQVAKLFGGKRT